MGNARLRPISVDDPPLGISAYDSIRFQTLQRLTQAFVLHGELLPQGTPGKRRAGPKKLEELVDERRALRVLRRRGLDDFQMRGLLILGHEPQGDRSWSRRGSVFGGEEDLSPLPPKVEGRV